MENTTLVMQTAHFPQVSNIRHLLIDLDGTLLGLRDWPLRIEFIVRAITAFKKHGGFMKSVKVIQAMQNELDHPTSNATNRERVAKVFSQFLEVTPEEADKILNEVAANLFPAVQKHFFPINGASDFLKWAKDRYPMILATNPVWTEDIVKIRMKWADIDPSLFLSITHSGRMHACKPSKNYYLEILNQEKLKDSECILIGNDPKKDLPATEAGIPVFIISNSSELTPLHRPTQKAAAWRGSFENLKQLLSPTEAGVASG